MIPIAISVIIVIISLPFHYTLCLT